VNFYAFDTSMQNGFFLSQSVELKKKDKNWQKKGALNIC